MKIESNRANVDAAAGAKLEAALAKTSKGREQGAPISADAVTVSGDVGLAHKAIDSASQPIGVRPEAVARGQALLAAGTLGEPLALADALIQRLIDNEE